VLAPLKRLPASAVDTTALFDFGEELGGDVAVVSYRPVRGQLAQLAATLSRLPWSSPRTSRTVRRFVAAQRRLFGLAPSHLCADARALVASHGRRIPRGTAQWLTRFRGAVRAEQTVASQFMKVLERSDSPRLLRENDRLFRHLDAALKGVKESDAEKIVSGLGL
jgi:hypothetical protein